MCVQVDYSVMYRVFRLHCCVQSAISKFCSKYSPFSATWMHECLMSPWSAYESQWKFSDITLWMWQCNWNTQQNTRQDFYMGLSSYGCFLPLVKHIVGWSPCCSLMLGGPIVQRLFVKWLQYALIHTYVQCTIALVSNCTRLSPLPFGTERTCKHIPTWWPWIDDTASLPDFHTACPSEWRRTGTYMYTQTKAINNLAVTECSRDMVHKYYGGRTNTAALVLPPYPPQSQYYISIHLSCTMWKQ